MINKLLYNHTSPETAYVVEDYPYGFRLRCKIRYWLEYKKNKGFRLVSQTTNPKREFVTPAGELVEYWNKPKASTYCKFGGAMYLNEENHVAWSGLSEYEDVKESLEWAKHYGEAVPPEGHQHLKTWLCYKLAYDAARAKGEVKIGIGDNITVCQPDLTPEEFEQWKIWVKNF